MTIAVRYYSRSGKTKTVADTIAGATGVEAIPVDAPNAALANHVDVLFVGGALYAYGLDKHLSSYLGALDANMVGKAVLFSTSWLSKHALDLMRTALESKGIAVEDETLYLRSGAVDSAEAQVREFATRHADE
mgnify:CR=1 FL=1